MTTHRHKSRHDVCPDCLSDLAEAALELLPMAMFYFWLSAREDHEPESLAVLDKMRTALMQCGLEASPYEEFCKRLERTLTEKKALR